ncbi:Conserved_hypothetical protein [Hexamita inflata]|uniref:Uncharacterized protein n=1 Tax=Hexamita inflata TaxID=28002 RepID=A0AA86UAE7_9EUKA|nr:Conserved hypothetical protein [Hexamita inflata]
MYKNKLIKCDANGQPMDPNMNIEYDENGKPIGLNLAEKKKKKNINGRVDSELFYYINEEVSNSFKIFVEILTVELKEHQNIKHQNIKLSTWSQKRSENEIQKAIQQSFRNQKIQVSKLPGLNFPVDPLRNCIESFNNQRGKNIHNLFSLEVEKDESELKFGFEPHRNDQLQLNEIDLVNPLQGLNQQLLAFSQKYNNSNNNSNNQANNSYQFSNAVNQSNSNPKSLKNNENSLNKQIDKQNKQNEQNKQGQEYNININTTESSNRNEFQQCQKCSVFRSDQIVQDIPYLDFGDFGRRPYVFYELESNLNVQFDEQIDALTPNLVLNNLSFLEFTRIEQKIDFCTTVVLDISANSIQKEQNQIVPELEPEAPKVETNLAELTLKSFQIESECKEPATKFELKNEQTSIDAKLNLTINEFKTLSLSNIQFAHANVSEFKTQKAVGSIIVPIKINVEQFVFEKSNQSLQFEPESTQKQIRIDLMAETNANPVISTLQFNDFKKQIQNKEHSKTCQSNHFTDVDKQYIQNQYDMDALNKCLIAELQQLNTSLAQVRGKTTMYKVVTYDTIMHQLVDQKVFDEFDVRDKSLPVFALIFNIQHESDIYLQAADMLIENQKAYMNPNITQIMQFQAAERSFQKIIQQATYEELALQLLYEFSPQRQQFELKLLDLEMIKTCFENHVNEMLEISVGRQNELIQAFNILQDEGTAAALDKCEQIRLWMEDEERIQNEVVGITEYLKLFAYYDEFMERPEYDLRVEQVQ